MLKLVTIAIVSGVPCSRNVSSHLVSKSIHHLQPWFERLVTADSLQCSHTFNFMHYFLPHVNCPSKERVGKCNDGSKWLCGRSQLAKRGRSCVVYSFGSSGNSCFESGVAQLLPHCEIHIFDPTSRKLRDARWTYHAWGLGGRDATETRYYNWRLGKPALCNGCVMKTLTQIMQLLKHDYIDVLKVDVDGAEWRAFEAVFEDFGPRVSLPFGQLQFEATGLDITPHNSSRIAKFWSQAFQRGLAAFHLETNPGTCRRRDKAQGTSAEYALLNTKKEMSLTGSPCEDR